MERLTKLGNLGLYMPKKLIDDNRSYCEEYCFEGCDLCPVCDCFQKLAEYEDTGLEPDEIEILKEECERLKDEKENELWEEDFKID